MKKTYKNPTLKVVKIQPAQFIAASEIKVASKKFSGGTVLGREAEFSDWDEDEE